MELVIFIGLQGSGKSTYYRNHFAATHVHISKDLMTNTRNRDARQQQLLHEALAAGSSVVIDNTNPTPESRAPLVAIGRQYGARIIAIVLQVPVKTALARNAQREGKARVPKVAIFSTAKKMLLPTIEEGFDEVRVVSMEAVNAETNA
jgi:predicted kinase